MSEIRQEYQACVELGHGELGAWAHKYGADLLAEVDRLRDKEKTLRDALSGLVEAVERDAARAAWKADLGASEWEAFIGNLTHKALIPARAALSLDESSDETR